MSLVSRVQNILLKPKEEWAVIDAEPATVGGLITGYALILAVIAPIMSLLGIMLTPFSSLIFHLPVVLIELLILSYATAFLPPVVVGFALGAIGPNMGGTGDKVQAMKLAVYSGTAFWVAAVLILLNPYLWLLVGVAYAGYLLWVGAPIVGRVPVDKAPAYVGAAIAIWVVTFFIFNYIGQRIIFAAVFSSMTGGMM